MTDTGAITQAIQALEEITTLLVNYVEDNHPEDTTVEVSAIDEAVKSLEALKAFKDNAPRGVNYGGLNAAIHLQDGIK